MKKDKIKFSILMSVIVVVMFVVYMKVNMERMNKGTCVNGMNSSIIEEKQGQFDLLVKKSYKTNSDRCAVVDMEIAMSIDQEKIIFRNTKQDEYANGFSANLIQDNKQNTVAKEDIELVSKYATLDQNKVMFAVEVEVREKGKVNTYEIKDEILLSIKDGKIKKGK